MNSTNGLADPNHAASQSYPTSPPATDPSRRPSSVAPFAMAHPDFNHRAASASGPTRHGHSQSTGVLLNNQSSSRQIPNGQSQHQAVYQRSVSMRPMSAFQPLDNPDYYAKTASSPTSPRPPSPTGSTARSIRSTQPPLTFKSHDLRSALSLQESQQKKLYMEGYLLKRDDLGTDGKPVHSAEDRRSWTECFVQLSGTVLSLWNVQQMEEADRQGTEVPPTYINITDSFVDFIGLLIEDPKLVPNSRGRYHHAFAINSAGNNRTLFCFRDPPPFPPDTIEQWLAPERRQQPEHRTVIGWLNLGHRYLQAWINAIRLASWEKVRLEEIYTGALLRARLGAVGGPNLDSGVQMESTATSSSEVTIRSPLTKGKMEGWVKARFMGTTEWKKVWLVLTDHKPDESEFGAKKKFWKLGSSGDRSSVMSMNSVTSGALGGPGPNGNELPPPPGSNGAAGVASFFESKKAKKPFSTLIYAAHTFAVYPSRPELVEGSSLFKVEGVFPSSTILSATHRVRSTGWVMLMPELEGTGSKGANAEMMKWIIAFMDCFRLYGRPESFVWEARDPVSPFFAYPIGPFKDRLFLDRELAEFLEIAREDHLTSRFSLHGIMAARMRGERTKILQPLPPPPVSKGSSSSNVAPKIPQDQKASQPTAHAQKLPLLDFESVQSKDSSAFVSELSADTTPIDDKRDSDHQGGAVKDLSDTRLIGINSTPRSTSPNSDAPKSLREIRAGFAQVAQPVAMPHHGSHSVQSSSSAPLRGENAIDAAPAQTAAAPTLASASASASASVSAPVQMQTAFKQHQPATKMRNEPLSTDLQGAQAPESHSTVDRLGSASVSQSTSAHITDPSPAYTNSFSNPPSSNTHPHQPTSRAPQSFGPSGRGAEQMQSDSNHHKLDSDLPTNYEESALFYMASISDQLPAITSHAAAPAAPATQHSEASPSRTLASEAAPVIPSGSAHVSQITSESLPRESDRQTTKVDYDPAERPAQVQEDTINDDALAAYSFLEQPPSPAIRVKSISSGRSRADSPQDGGLAPTTASIQHSTSQDTAKNPAVTSADGMRPNTAPYPSTFGQNKRALERKTAAELQAQAHQEALSRPGRSGVSKLKGQRRAGWADDSEEEEEEEEEDEDDEDYKNNPRKAMDTKASQGLPERTGSNSPSVMTDSIGSVGRHNEPSSHLGYSRTGSSYGASNLAGSNSGSRSQSPAQVGRPHPSIQTQNRQSMFNNHLTAGHGDVTPPQGTSARDRQTFVQLNPEEQPGAMTAVFTPHGLVQAGAQDKAERSAKAQEAEARAFGTHMVNVPNKPPPPQAGLLGAITAHERDRKGAGGYGATLTERERERLAAEKRQREEDFFRQQQQQQQQQQMQQMAYFNPMMYQQMMMGGMMPGMGMMGMGMPGMGGYPGSPMAGSQMGGMGGFDPMMAQQQAMQAAQMAYMNALSQAHQEGSTLGHGTAMGHGPGATASPSTLGMPMGTMPFMASPHLSMMGSPFPGFMAPSGMGSPSSDANALPRSPYMKRTSSNGQANGGQN